MELNFSTFACANGGFMRWARAHVTTQTTRGHVLILPGWGEWIEKYDEMAGEWVQRGYHVTILEWRGQGLSSRFMAKGEASWIPSFDVLVKDLQDFFVAQIADETLPLLLFGHSMGAHLALRWCMEYPASQKTFKKLILASVMQGLITKPFPLAMTKLIVAAANLFGMGKAYAPGQAQFDQSEQYFPKNVLTHDEARFNRMMQQLRDRPELKVGGMSFGQVGAALRSVAKLEGALGKNPPQLATLMLIPQDDPLVKSSAMREVAGQIPYCQTVEFPDARHELFMEQDSIRKKAWEAVEVFIAA